MGNSHDEIKKLLKASRSLLTTEKVNEDIQMIRKNLGLITEDRYNVADSIENEATDDDYETAETDGDEKEETSEDKKQGYRISGGILVLHGKDQGELELTTDEKAAFQETMDEFVNEVSDLVDFNKLNVYRRNVEWSGRIVDFDIDFYFTIGEENGVYINGKMIKTDDDFLEMIQKLKTYYDKFKSKWSKVLANRKRTSND